jgi:periplasmic glucans biosynthesis protein
MEWVAGRCRAFGWVLLATLIIGGSRGSAFDFSDVVAAAKQRLIETPEGAPEPLPPPLDQMDYDSYRMIGFQFDQATWRFERRGFALEYFHRGYLYPQRVDISIVTPSGVEPIVYRPQMFQFRGPLEGTQPTENLGFAGWRLLGWYQGEENPREMGALLGASYWRVLGAKHSYGSSVRGLAINIAQPPLPEEFPRFSRYWIERPEAGDGRLRWWSIQESQRSVAAFQFDLTPGESTIVDVRCRVFFRFDCEKIGLTPITSMWMWGGGLNPPSGDARPEVHDADGLLVRGERGAWTFRPLRRPQQVVVEQYPVEELKGFGLLQRNRDADAYKDPEARYVDRPSIWIEPENDWGPGHVELLRMPAQHEGEDNMGCYFVPKRPGVAGSEFELLYRVHVTSDEPVENLGGRFVRTEVVDGGPQRWDFRLVAEGGALTNLAAGSKIEPILTVDRGVVQDAIAERIDDGKWEVTFSVRGDDKEQPPAIRGFLKRGNDFLTETWAFRCD